MDTYTVYGITGATRDDNAARIRAYLEGKGYTVGDVSTRFEIFNDALHVTVTTDRDPEADLRAYTSTPTPKETERAAILAAGQGVAAAARANPNAPRTPQEINAFITAVTELLPELAS